MKAEISPIGQKSGESVKMVIIVPEAWAWYNNPLSLKGMRPRNVIPLPKLYEVSVRLGRPLNAEDLQAMMAVWGMETVCTKCGKSFQPVRFVLVDDFFLTEVNRTRDTLLVCRNAGALWGGNFYPGEKAVMSACGPHFFFSPGNDVAFERFGLNRLTCAGQVSMDSGNKPLMTFEDATHELVRLSRECKSAPVASQPPVGPVELAVKETEHGPMIVVREAEDGKVSRYARKSRQRRRGEAA